MPSKNRIVIKLQKPAANPRKPTQIDQVTAAKGHIIRGPNLSTSQPPKAVRSMYPIPNADKIMPNCVSVKWNSFFKGSMTKEMAERSTKLMRVIKKIKLVISQR